MFFRHLRFFSRKHGRISDTNPREIKSLLIKRGRPCKNLLVTLDPKKFAELKQQRLDICNQASFKPSGPGLALTPCLHYDKTTQEAFYPPDTKAFLYYFMSPEKPRIAGELRLRVASSDDFASFESGSDLLGIDGQPWSRPLYVLSQYYLPLYEKLREERLVPDELDTVLSTLRSTIYSKKHGWSNPLYTLNDTFIVDFSSVGFFFFVITEQGVSPLPLREIFLDRRGPRGMCTVKPYTGSALARFERSTLLDHKGTRTIVLRFLKIITPVQCVEPFYDNYIRCPMEGGLHQRNIKNRPVIWSVNIDGKSKRHKAMKRGLQLLWNT